MKATGLKSLIYPTDNVTKDKQWWATALGMEPYFDTKEYVGFSVGDNELGLFADGKTQDGPVTYLGVEDIDSAYKELLENGCKMHEKIVDVGGGIRLGSVRNPAGHLVGVIFNPNAKKT